MEGLDLEVNSVAHLRVPVSDESDVEEGMIDAKRATGFAVGKVESAELS